MRAIWRRELQAYFCTPVGYVFMGVFLAVSSVMFFLVNLQARSSDLLSFIGEMSYLWMLLCPVLTMRLLAEERQKRTDQLLLTSPVSPAGIALGKYAAAVTVMLLTVLLTLGYAAVIALFGRVYPAELSVGYLGFVLQGCAFIAVDLYVSARARTPITAAILAFGVNLALWLVDLLAEALPVWLRNVCTFFSLYSRNEPFLMGQLSWATVVYDLSVTAAFLVLTIHCLDSRRWRRA